MSSYTHAPFVLIDSLHTCNNCNGLAQRVNMILRIEYSKKRILGAVLVSPNLVMLIS